MLKPTDCSALQKVLVKESQTFTEKVHEAYKQPNCPWDARNTSITEGAAMMLGMDDALAQKLHDHAAAHRDNMNMPTVHVLDRDHLGQKHLV